MKIEDIPDLEKSWEEQETADKKLMDKEKLWQMVDFCGCSEEKLVDDLYTVFSLFLSDDPPYITKIVEKTQLNYYYIHLMLNVFEAAGLTEHGSAVRGSWINYDIRDFIKKHFGWHEE